MKPSHIQQQTEMGEGAGSADLFQVYIRDVRRHPAFRHGEARKHFRRMKAETHPVLRSRLFEEAVTRNLMLVVKVGFWYVARGHAVGLTLPDLIQEGSIGLMIAVDRYDEEHEAEFSTYAVYWIRQTITRAIMNYSVLGGGRIPIHLQERMSKASHAARQAEHVLEREPTLFEVFEQSCEIARTKGTPPLTLHEIGQALSLLGRSTLSLDGEEDDADENVRLYSILPQKKPPPDTVVEAKEELAMVQAVVDRTETFVSTLSPRTKDVLSLRLGLFGKHVLVLDEIGLRYGITRERIRQIEFCGMSQLEEAVGFTRDEIREVLRMREALIQFIVGAY